MNQAEPSRQVVLLDRPAAHVARLRINRPEKRNAIDHGVRQAMTEALAVALADPDTRALVIGGVDGVFSAGGDVPSMVGLDEAGARARMQHIHVLCRLVADARLPVVSAVEGIGAGAAVGLALLGDEIVVGEGTKILFPFLKLGLVPDWGQLLTLPRRVGLPAARRILTSGAPVTGSEAFRIGLADALVADAEVMPTAVNRAAELARLPLGAFARMKDRLNQVSGTLDEELQREEADQAVCLLGTEFVEGYDAYKNKRAADFIGLPGTRS
ncbi:enoyl-CoA hydratase/isomerase family protein [Variovorax ginsengisoli]|uniref:2-(1,2-epoxy-1,2-dihydrophenyl)acetyl-CoA isomerase n=1 Tax=Variovorax ginsengisoli TaxID=363844 RepID=A0ABT9S9D2_9BURK|nr:enoyl-CoA hydratase/isomerase family protein [Variovorax ginsengisoli]MDP9900972.1 2-(1,2-epoxy-1,2-dihydrophenyl)acetyl-CoA isomerase [Variovorax ginsengisoli]